MNETPHREPWEADFPKVFLHCSLEARSEKPDYLAAKAGDETAAIQLTRQL
jgi:hypothetical protein